MNQAIRNRLSRSFFFMRDADKGGAAGGAPATAPEPVGDNIENKLTSARSIIADLWSKLTGAQSGTKSLQSQFDSATQAVDNEKAEHGNTKGLLATANETINTLTRERDEAKGNLDTATKNVGRLEKLCGLHNIDPNAAPVVESNDEDSKTNTPSGKWATYQQLRADEKTGKVSPGSALAFYQENRKELNLYAASQRKSS